ncbi:MAG: phage holin family protein [Gammaproteobacteria bacterium]|nr:phage holin family protein [Gammaproteobacteria bacterium]
MPGFLLRWMVVALSLWLASAIVPGMVIDGGWTLVFAAALLGLVNAVIRPVIIILTLPITLLTLGLFLLVINAAMLGLVARMLGGFAIAGFFPALLGAIIVSLTGWIASGFIDRSGRYRKLDRF